MQEVRFAAGHAYSGVHTINCIGGLVEIPVFTRLGDLTPRHLPADHAAPPANVRGAPQPHT